MYGVSTERGEFVSYLSPKCNSLFRIASGDLIEVPIATLFR